MRFVTAPSALQITTLNFFVIDGLANHQRNYFRILAHWWWKMKNYRIALWSLRSSPRSFELCTYNFRSPEVGDSSPSGPERWCRSGALLSFRISRSCWESVFDWKSSSGEAGGAIPSCIWGWRPSSEARGSTTTPPECSAELSEKEKQIVIGDSKLELRIPYSMESGSVVHARGGRGCHLWTADPVMDLVFTEKDWWCGHQKSDEIDAFSTRPDNFGALLRAISKPLSFLAHIDRCNNWETMLFNVANSDLHWIKRNKTGTRYQPTSILILLKWQRKRSALACWV